MLDGRYDAEEEGTTSNRTRQDWMEKRMWHHKKHFLSFSLFYWFFKCKELVRLSLGCGEKWMAGGAELTLPVIQFVIIRRATASTIPLFTLLYYHLQSLLIPILLRVESKEKRTTYQWNSSSLRSIGNYPEFSQLLIEKFLSLWII